MKAFEIIKSDYNTRYRIFGRDVLTFHHYYRMVFDCKKASLTMPEQFDILNLDYELITRYCEGFDVLKFFEVCKKKFVGFIVMDSQDPVGYICGSCKKNRLYIKYVYVYPSYRGHGYSQNLINIIKEKTCLQGYYLNVRPNNIAAVKSYERAGGVFRMNSNIAQCLN